MKTTLSIFTFICFCCSLLAADPFGLEMGWSINQILEAGARIKEGEEHETEYLLALDVPTPHPDLTVYIALVDKEVGLYYIQAVGVGSSDPKAGIALEDLYDKPRAFFITGHSLGGAAANLIAALANNPETGFFLSNCSVIYSGLNSSVIRQRNYNKGMNAL